MKKTLNHIFDEANANEIENFVKQNAAPEVSADTLSAIKDKVYAKTNLKKERKTNKNVWLRFGAIAACFLLIVSAIIVVPMLREDDPGIIPNPDNDSNLPIVNIQTPTSEPHYYGNESSSGMSSDANMDANPAGISVTAKLIEMLPDTYTFFDDWNQYEYRLLRMKTVKLLRGTEMTEEFYYMVPVAFVTDFSVYDSFVIKNMAQFAYDYSVMYNKTQGKAEQLNLPLFGYRVYGYHLMGENFAAYNADGNFDERLWNANKAWIEETNRAPIINTIAQAETIIQQEDDGWGNDFYVHLLKDISGEAANVLDSLKSFDNGIFVPTFSSSKLYLLPEVQFHAVRYINGFATNEKVSVWCKEWTDGDQDTYAFTKARFNEEDMNRLPDLPSAFESVKDGLKSRSVTPPHFNNQEKLRNTTSGVFGWYAKTENGVIGIVRVTWCFYTEKYQYYYDDAYYIIEYGSDECKAINRDALLELLGDYEATYIYTGEYNEYGKYSDIVYPEM